VKAVSDDNVISASEFQALADKVDALEAQVAFQDDTLGQLNEVIAKQDAVIMGLEKRVGLLLEKLKGMEDTLETMRAPEGNERPPHY